MKNPRILLGIILVVLSMGLMVGLAMMKRKPHVNDLGLAEHGVKAPTPKS